MGRILSGKSSSTCLPLGVSQLTENNSLSWSELFIKYREKIEKKTDLLGPPVNNLDDELNDEETDHEYEKLEDEEQMRPDWMILSEIRPDANFEVFRIGIT